MMYSLHKAEIKISEFQKQFTAQKLAGNVNICFTLRCRSFM
jgi:hypothetical protein